MAPPLLRLSSSGVWVPEHESTVEQASDIVARWIDAQAPPAPHASPAKSTTMLLPGGVMLFLSVLSQLGAGISLVNIDAIAAAGRKTARRATSSTALVLSSAQQPTAPSRRSNAPAASPASRPILSSTWLWLGAFLALLWWWVHLVTHSGPFPTTFCPYFGYCD